MNSNKPNTKSKGTKKVGGGAPAARVKSKKKGYDTKAAEKKIGIVYHY